MFADGRRILKPWFIIWGWLHLSAYHEHLSGHLLNDIDAWQQSSKKKVPMLVFFQITYFLRIAYHSQGFLWWLFVERVKFSFYTRHILFYLFVYMLILQASLNCVQELLRDLCWAMQVWKRCSNSSKYMILWISSKKILQVSHRTFLEVQEAWLNRNSCWRMYIYLKII